MHAGVRGIQALVVRRLDGQDPDLRHRGQRPVERVGVTGPDQCEPARGPAEHRGDAFGREARFDGQVHTARLEDPEHGGRPAEVALTDHGHHVLRAQALGQQGASQPVGACVEFPVRPLPPAPHDGDRVRVRPGLLREDLVGPQLRQVPPGSGEFLDLMVEFGRAQEALWPRCGVRVGGEPFQRGAVVSHDPCGEVLVVRVRPVTQTPRPPTVFPVRHRHPQGRAAAVGAVGGPVALTIRIEHDDGSGTGEVRAGRGGAGGVDGRLSAAGRRPGQGGQRPVHVEHQRPPGIGRERQAAGPWGAARHGDAGADDLGLPGQRAEDLEVRGRQHRRRAHAEVVGEVVESGQEGVGDHRAVLGRAG